MSGDVLTTTDMARRYKCFKRGTLEPSTAAFLEWRRRHPEKIPEPIKKGRWLLIDVVRFESEKPWMNAKPKKSGGRKRNSDFELRVS